MKIKLFTPFFIILAVSLLYTRPFFNQGYFLTDDGQWAIVRLSEMIRELKDFQIPPRWSDYLNHGYGYPLFSFTYPLPYYLGAFVRLLGLSLTDSIKFLFVISVFLSGIFMFLLGKELLGNIAGLIASLFYISTPYRLTNLYVRGSLGESLAFVIFPLLCYGSLLYLKKQNKWSFLLTSASLAVMILTHNATALLFFPFWILFLLAIIYDNKRTFKQFLIYYLPIILLGIGISAYFLFPVIFEKKYISLSQNRISNIKEYFVSPFNLGIFNIVGFLLGLLSVRRLYFILFFIISVSLGIFLITPPSAIFWTIPQFNFLDFPFRVLAPLSFILSLSTAFIVLRKNILWIGLFITVLTLIYNLQYVSIKEYFSRPDSYYRTNDATTTSNDELMPIWVKEKPANRYQEKVEVAHGDADISSVKYTSKNISFNIRAKTDSKVVINTLYFPGWQMTLNREKTPLDVEDKKGIMSFTVSPGNYEVEARFKETHVRIISNIISLSSLLISLIIILKPNKYELDKSI